MSDQQALPSAERLAYLLSGDLQDDDIPLWEIVWGLNTRAPDAPLTAKLRIARRAVSQLGDECELWRGSWPGGPESPLTDLELRVLAEDDAVWCDPEKASLLIWLRPVT